MYEQYFVNNTSGPKFVDFGRPIFGEIETSNDFRNKEK